MPKIEISFGNGIQVPPKLGASILKLVSKGKVAYAQNIDFQSDEYGDVVPVPGPVLNTIGSNSELTGVPILKAKAGISGTEYIHFAEGILGSTARLRRVKNVGPGETPVIDTTGSIAVAHSAHSGPVVQDMEYFEDSNNNRRIYITGVDATDVWIQKYDAVAASPSLSAVAINEDSDITATHYILRGDDKMLYYSWGNRVDKYDPNNSDAETESVLVLPTGYGITALGKYQTFICFAYHTPNFPYDFSLRKGSGEAGVIFWDYATNTFIRDLKIANTYISVLVTRPSGELIAFGGLREGKTTIYQYSGYGFSPLISYIGDMPRNRHSVDFDSQGRIIWQTVDGQVCRYNFTNEIFEHLTTITSGSSSAGILTSLLGSTGNEFLVAAGNVTSYLMKKLQFGAYIGDGDSASDEITTPLLISGIYPTLPKSMIESMDVLLAKSLATGEKIQIRLYKNGIVSSPIVYGTLSFAGDGAISGKRIKLHKYGIDNFSVGVLWKTADNFSTAPGILSMVVNVKNLR